MNSYEFDHNCAVSSHMTLTSCFFLCVCVLQCERDVEHVQQQLEDYKHPPLSLSRLSLKQHKFKSFRESAVVSLFHNYS